MGTSVVIHVAVGCHVCHKPLRNSPSDDFCSDTCQSYWHQERIGADGFTMSPAPEVCAPAAVAQPAALPYTGNGPTWATSCVTMPGVVN